VSWVQRLEQCRGVGWQTELPLVWEILPRNRAELELSVPIMGSRSIVGRAELHPAVVGLVRSPRQKRVVVSHGTAKIVNKSAPKGCTDFE
jgi:hypothetical protein